MGDRLRVDLVELSETACALTALVGDFQDAEKNADAASADVGSSEISDALNAFATNWNYHKKKLVSTLEAVRDMADQSRETYIGVDEQLAQEMVDAMSRPVGQ